VTSIRCNGIEALAHYFVSQAVFHGRHDAIEEFNLDSKAECGQLNLAHVAKKTKNCKKQETKQIRQYHLVWSKAKNCEDGLDCDCDHRLSWSCSSLSFALISESLDSSGGAINFFSGAKSLPLPSLPLSLLHTFPPLP